MITRSWHLRARQRVHNALHHLDDCSLPHEHWNRDTELAAIIALLRRSPRLTAARRFSAMVRRFVQSYRQIGIFLDPLDEHEAEARVAWVADFMDSLPDGYSDADVYVALLELEGRGVAA